MNLFSKAYIGHDNYHGDRNQSYQYVQQIQYINTNLNMEDERCLKKHKSDVSSQSILSLFDNDSSGDQQSNRIDSRLVFLSHEKLLQE